MAQPRRIALVLLCVAALCLLAGGCALWVFLRVLSVSRHAAPAGEDMTLDPTDGAEVIVVASAPAEQNAGESGIARMARASLRMLGFTAWMGAHKTVSDGNLGAAAPDALATGHDRDARPVRGILKRTGEETPVLTEHASLVEIGDDGKGNKKEKHVLFHDSHLTESTENKRWIDDAKRDRLSAWYEGEDEDHHTSHRLSAKTLEDIEINGEEAGFEILQKLREHSLVHKNGVPIGKRSHSGAVKQEKAAPWQTSTLFSFISLGQREKKPAESVKKESLTPDQVARSLSALSTQRKVAKFTETDTPHSAKRSRLGSFVGPAILLQD